MKNIVFYTILATYVLLYIIGTVVAISTKNIGLTAAFFSTLAFIGGLHLGRWTVKKEQQMV